jgi:hypothetical protein
MKLISGCIEVNKFRRCFAEKVDVVCGVTSDTSSPSFSQVPPGMDFTSSSPVVGIDDAIVLSNGIPTKAQMPTNFQFAVLKTIATEIAPFLVELFNRPSSAGAFPREFRMVQDRLGSCLLSSPASGLATRVKLRS